MGRRGEEASGGFPAWGGEAVLWAGCLSAAVVPTGLALMAWRAWVGAVAPVAGLGAYVVFFTLFVVMMKPWTVR